MMYAGYGMPRRARTTIPAHVANRVRVAAQRRGGMSHSPDVVASCTRCGGPVFLCSRNATESRGHLVDGTSKQQHLRCPQVSR